MKINDEFLTAKDMAVLAVRKNDMKYINEGLMILNEGIIDEDPNDIITDLTLLYNSIIKLEQINPDGYLLDSAIKSTNKLKKVIIDFTKRNPNDKTLKSMGYKEVYAPEFDYVFSL